MSSSSSSSSSSASSTTNRHHHRRKHRPRGRRHYDSATRSSLDKQRIEAIKEQILSKLGMTAKPNITKARSTRFLVEALAVEPLSGLTAADPDVTGGGTSGGNTLPPSTRLPSTRDADSEPDDFYGRTKEIIGFAEPGERNSNFLKVLRFIQEGLACIQPARGVIFGTRESVA